MLLRPDVPVSTQSDPGELCLAVWQCPWPPTSRNLAAPMNVRRIADHRRAFLTWEGPLRDDLGRCRMVEKGVYRPRLIRETLWLVEFGDGSLTGEARLERCGEGDLWTLTVDAAGR